MSLDAILDDMAVYLQEKLPELKTCQMMGGRLNLDETSRRSIALPAAYFACPGTREGRMIGDKFRTTGLFVLVLLVRSSPEGQPTPQDRAHAIARFAGKALAVVAAAKNWETQRSRARPTRWPRRTRTTPKPTSGGSPCGRSPGSSSSP